LNLYYLSIPSAPKRQIMLNYLTIEERSKEPEELDDATSEISEFFGTAPPKKTINVIVQRPLGAVIWTNTSSILALVKQYERLIGTKQAP
ncbi:hypothetical protein BX616_009592, partial [Lobosporangium transversale]